MINCQHTLWAYIRCGWGGARWLYKYAYTLCSPPGSPYHPLHMPSQSREKLAVEPSPYWLGFRQYCPMLVTSARRRNDDGDVISLTRHAVNTQHSSIQSERVVL